MRLKETQTVDADAGQSERRRPASTREWVCPDCDYFEEAEEESSR